MGTSQSSTGPGAGTALVPPWADPLPDGAGDDERDADAGAEDTTPPTVAPGRRFADARRGVGNFATTGDSKYIPRVLRHYVSTGYGGAGTFTHRMGTTAKRAHRLGAILGGASATIGLSPDPLSIATGSARQLIAAIVNAVAPIDGTLDAEASRQSTASALTDLLTRYPDADLAQLRAEEREFAVERFLAHDVFARFVLDLEGAVDRRSSDALTLVQRLSEVRDYVCASIAAAFDRLRSAGTDLGIANTRNVATQVLRDTFKVFEGYIG